MRQRFADFTALQKIEGGDHAARAGEVGTAAIGTNSRCREYQLTIKLANIPSAICAIRVVGKKPPARCVSIDLEQDTVDYAADDPRKKYHEGI